MMVDMGFPCDVKLYFLDCSRKVDAKTSFPYGSNKNIKQAHSSAVKWLPFCFHPVDGRPYLHESEYQMHPLFTSFGRALYSQFHFRMMLLTFLPFIILVAIWYVVLSFSFNPMIDLIQGYFVAYDWFKVTSSTLGWLGLGSLKTVIVPLIAMWLLLPLLILSALLMTGMLTMPAIVKHVASRHHFHLEARKGGGLWRSLWIAVSSYFVFALLWIVSLPLAIIPPLGFVIQPILWGWLTYRVITFDALAEHADAEELKMITKSHRRPLLLIGMITGAMGTVPMLMWLGGILTATLSVVLLPVLAGLAIWLYLMVFVFTGLWFEHYCLAALAKHRTSGTAGGFATADPPMLSPSPQLKDIN